MKQFETREIGENEDFNPNDLCDNVPFTQASFYGNWQKSLGRRVRRFLVSSDNQPVAYFQLIQYPLLLGKSYLYIPYGPVIRDLSEDLFINLKNTLRHIAKAQGAVFVRLDFTPPIPHETLSKFFTKAPLYTYHSAYFQPRTEWFLSLEKPEDEILAGMDKKTRYSIRLAEQRGITVEIVTEDFEHYFETFYELMIETAKRNGFSLHPKNYYKNIFQNLSRDYACLSVARYEQKIVAIDLIIIFGNIATYVFGCSNDEDRSRVPTYLAQWRVLLYAKQQNCLYYNFGGISSANKTYTGWEGLTSFKKKFGGQEVAHSDFFDVVVDPFWYHLYNLRKRIKKLGL